MICRTRNQAKPRSSGFGGYKRRKNIELGWNPHASVMDIEKHLSADVLRPCRERFALRQRFDGVRAEVLESLGELSIIGGDGWEIRRQHLLNGNILHGASGRLHGKDFGDDGCQLRWTRMRSWPTSEGAEVVQ